MPTTSTIPAFKAALTARLAADPALAAVQVSEVDPFPDRAAEEMVVVSRALPNDALRDSTFGGGQTSAAMGRRGREERYVVEVLCRVLRSIQVPAPETENRAYALCAVVESSVMAWAGEVPPFGGLVRVAVVVRTDDWHGNDDQRREARVTVGIGCSVRIGI
jgi:hypothetical protein